MTLKAKVNNLYTKIHDVLVHVPLVHEVGRLVMFIHRYGFRPLFARIKRRFKSPFKRFSLWRISKKERRAQNAAVFDKPIVFSVLVPLYNTPLVFLNELIGSLKDQTYRRWELCFADGSDADHADVGKLCRRLTAGDTRIRYSRLPKNMGISENTNACLRMATGDYFVLLDHDDLLHPSALYYMAEAINRTDADLLYSDETTFSKHPTDAYFHHYKPDFSPDLLRSINYICHLTVFSRTLQETVGYFRSDYDGSQDYDMILRLSEQAKRIVHIPRLLYFWRAHAASVAGDISAKPYVLDAAKRAIAEHLKRVNLPGEVLDGPVISTYRIAYALKGTPKISIIIPNKDHLTDLQRCLSSVYSLSTYPNFEIIIVENGSEKSETFDYYTEQTNLHSNLRVVTWSKGFNFSAICNFGAEMADGQYLVMLNNDIEIITPDWLEQLLMYAQRDDVGAVGAKLYYPDDTIQHAGVILGVGGLAGHSHKGRDRKDSGYVNRAVLVQDLSAVTAALMMIPKKVFDEVTGFDPGYAVAFNDVDLCMKIRQKGYNIVFTPFCEAYHCESKSRGLEDSDEKIARFNSEVDRFMERWSAEVSAGDPYYNPNLDLTNEHFAPKPVES